MRRVLVCEPIAEDGLDLLRRHAQIDVRTTLSPEELVTAIAGYEGLVVRSQTRVTADVVEAGSELRVIGRAGVGVDNIDVEAATRRGVVVVNSPTAVNVAAAEHTLGMLLALARHIPEASASLRAGRWDRSLYTGVEIRGKVLGIIGIGNIGSEVARRAGALEMKLLATDPFASDEYASHLGARLVPLEELLGEADFVSLHVPLTAATHELIGRRELALLKPGARLLNCARGGIVDEQALLEAIESGRLAGAALDVFANEPPTGSPLLAHPRVVATPHLGASTEEAQVGAAVEVAEQVIAVLEDEPARYAVNAPALRSEALAALAPYLRLADTLGNVLAQLAAGSFGHLEIAYAGEIAREDSTALRAAAVNGLLREACPERVNLVNALLVARSRGLHVAERRSDEPVDNFANLIALRTDQNGTFVQEVAGTVINGAPHVVRVNDYRVDIVPNGGYLLFCHHKDRPGVIGRIGTLLGNHDVNISFMQVGRRQPRGDAMMVLGLDEPIREGDDLFKQILREGDIQTARLVRL